MSQSRETGTNPVIITIDGPAGSGKSTVARLVARRLGLPYLDTGAMYRAAGLLAEREGFVPPYGEGDGEKIAVLLEQRGLEFEAGTEDFRVSLDGEDLGEAIRGLRASELASAVSALGEVRRALVPIQRRLGHAVGGVAEGRDMGSVVFPGATLKLFLTASPEVRARRRLRDLELRGEKSSLEEVLERQKERDLRDTTRADSPLIVPPGAVTIDTSELSPDEVAARILARLDASVGSVLDSSERDPVKSRNDGRLGRDQRVHRGGTDLNTDPATNGNNQQDNGTMESMDQLSMEELVESSFHEVKEGEVVRGTVVAITNDEVMVDVGYKSEGVISLSECIDRETGEVNLEIGQEVEVYVARIDEMEGVVRLSRERAAKLKTWTAIEQAWKNGESVKGRVLERVKGGLAVDIGVRAFLPGSLVDLRLNRRLEDYIGEEIEAQIISFDRRRSNVVLSRKAILEEAQKEAKEATMAELEEGKLVTGTVKNITDYGVFIDLGGLDGLLHITDISWGRVGHPSEYFKVGDEVDVVVLRFDRERERVSLGYKQRFEDPWVLVPEKYPLGKRVNGKVVSIVEYGAFVELEEGVEGLIHVSEMSWTKKIKNPRSVLDVGNEVEVVVSEVDSEKRRLSLSLRATEPNPWEEVAEKYQIGSKIRGTVRNLTDFGAFVEIVPGVDGLVHISDMSWTRRINHPSEVVQKGQEVDAVITSIDVISQRISLSMKDLLPNEWEEYANTHGVGDIVSGKVTNVTDFGVFIELSPGVEGLCHVSEIDRGAGFELAEMFSQGQAVRCRILRIDWNENRIGLSMHGVVQDGAEEELVAATESAGAADTAMAAALKAVGLVAEEEASGEEPAAEGSGAAEEAAGEMAETEAEIAEEAAGEMAEAEAEIAEEAAGEMAEAEAETAEAAPPEETEAPVMAEGEESSLSEAEAEAGEPGEETGAAEEPEASTGTAGAGEADEGEPATQAVTGAVEESGEAATEDAPAEDSAKSEGEV